MILRLICLLRGRHRWGWFHGACWTEGGCILSPVGGHVGTEMLDIRCTTCRTEAPPDPPDPPRPEPRTPYRG